MKKKSKITNNKVTEESSRRYKKIKLPEMCGLFFNTFDNDAVNIWLLYVLTNIENIQNSEEICLVLFLPLKRQHGNISLQEVNLFLVATKPHYHPCFPFLSFVLF